MKITRHTLKKLEAIFDELDYELIYEKGSFKSGYCIVENKKVVVINKFFDVEARINCLIEILDNIEFQRDILTKESIKFLRNITHQEATLPIIDAE